METVGGERQLLGIRLQAAHVVHQALIDQTVAPACQHGGVDVGQQHQAVGPHLAGHSRGQVAGAAGHVQRALPGPQLGQLQRETFPEPMHARGHQVVHQVVASGDGIEDAAHAPGLLCPRHALETKIGGLSVFQGVV